MDDKRSRVLQIARQLEMGIYSQNQIAKTLHVSKNLDSTIMELRFHVLFSMCRSFLFHSCIRGTILYMNPVDKTL